MIAPDAILSARIEQYARPDHICLQENFGSFNRAVNVRLCRKVHHNVRLFAFKERIDCRTIRNVTAYKRELRILACCIERRQIPCIGQRIIAHNRILRVLAQFVVNKICADEPRAACHNNLHNLRSFSLYR